MNGIRQLVGPYFEAWIGRLAARVPLPMARIESLERLRKKIESHFTDVTTYADIDSIRKWTEFQMIERQRLAESSARIFTQNINKLLRMMHEDKKISFIRLKPPKRRKSSSEGFHVEQIMHFTFADVQTLWKRMLTAGSDECALMFMLLICTCCSVFDLLNLRVHGIGRWTITIDDGGLVHSIILEPARSYLFRYVLERSLRSDDRVFDTLTDTGKFSKWLVQKCREAELPRITPTQLVYFGRFLLVLQGVPPHIAAALGKKNAFSPLREDCYEQLDDFLRKNRDLIWQRSER